MHSINPPGKPPDITMSTKGQQNHLIDETRQLTNTTENPKYLIMKRINNDSSATLENVSPFLIKKIIDYVGQGPVQMCKKLRNGTLLIHTKNLKQAKKLIQITQLNDQIKVEVTEHTKLNTCKGVIYTNELRNIPEQEILEELKNQNVTEVKKILKKNNNELIETGLIILTFSLTTIPEQINIGYEKVKIEHYIPIGWVPGHEGITGNEEADRLAKVGAEGLFIGPEPFCGLPKSHRINLINEWEEQQKLSHWSMAQSARQAKKFIKQNKSKALEFLKLPKSELRTLVGLFTGHCPLRYHLTKMGIEDNKNCRFCKEEPETSEHILCRCKGIIRPRLKHMDQMYLTPDEVWHLPPKKILGFVKALEL